MVSTKGFPSLQGSNLVDSSRSGLPMPEGALGRPDPDPVRPGRLGKSCSFCSVLYVAPSRIHSYASRPMTAAPNRPRLTAQASLRKIPVDARRPSLKPSAQFDRLSSENTGILLDHASVAANLCKDKKCCMILRPTTAISLQLIDQGFATKSMDIKGKTSWLGLIVCDQAFSKKLVGNPDSSFTKPESYKGAHATQLKLSQEMLNFYVANECLDADVNNITNGDTLLFRPSQSATAPKGVVFEAQRTESGDYTLSWKPDAQDSSQELEETSTPVWVWGYQNKDESITPVTGDYDKFMCASSFEDASEDALQQMVEDEHGCSVLSRFADRFMSDFNRDVGREDKPVIWHGAEMQNINFAQPLDDSLVMFTPNGQGLTVGRESLPKALTDLAARGYYVKLNPAYYKDDLPIGGKPFGFLDSKKDQELISQMKVQVQELRGLYSKQFGLIVANESQVPKDFFKNSANMEAIRQSLDEVKGKIFDIISNKCESQDEQMKVFDGLNNILMFAFELDARMEELGSSEANLDLQHLRKDDFPTTETVIKKPEHRKAWVDFIRKSTNRPIYDPSNGEAAKNAVNEYNAEIKKLYEDLPFELKSYAALSSMGIA